MTSTPSSSSSVCAVAVRRTKSLSYAMLCYTLLYYTILYYTILFYILYHGREADEEPEHPGHERDVQDQ